MQDRLYYLAERDRGVDLAVCDGPQPRFDFVKVCQDPAVLLAQRGELGDQAGFPGA